MRYKKKASFEKEFWYIWWNCTVISKIWSLWQNFFGLQRFLFRFLKSNNSEPDQTWGIYWVFCFDFRNFYSMVVFLTENITQTIEFHKWLSAPFVEAGQKGTWTKRNWVRSRSLGQKGTDHKRKLAQKGTLKFLFGLGDFSKLFLSYYVVSSPFWSLKWI